ncbi:MAG: hypothetical protein WC483_03820 [Candidatus Paceibacterota bacterium]
MSVRRTPAISRRPPRPARSSAISSRYRRKSWRSWRPVSRSRTASGAPSERTSRSATS